MRTLAVLVFGALALRAEIRTMTLREVTDLALTQSPDVLLARFDESKATQSIRVARDPFLPKVVVGSGLAYTSGFPMSIEGSAPSIVQGRAVQTLFNRSQSYQVAQARENARGAALDSQARREDLLLRVASLYLDAERAARTTQVAARQIDSLERVVEAVRVRVREGRALELDNKRAVVDLARARQHAGALEAARDYLESSLALVLGLPAGDRVRTAEGDRPTPQLPDSEETATASAIEKSKEIRRLESALQAKALEIRANQASHLPRINLVAQYGLFARFNNYDDFFRRFDRHNGQLGVSVELPLLTGSAASALAAQSQADSARLRLELTTARARIARDTRHSFLEMKNAEGAREVARLDLDWAREQVSVLLAQMEEGRANLRQVEEARFIENEKWMSFFGSQTELEKARLTLLKHTGALLAALR